jgi:ketosteroid isomerase-like protein
MKTKLTLVVALTFLFALNGCKEKQEESVAKAEVKIDLVNDEFPEAKAEVMALMDELTETIKSGDVDKLISFHAYGPKFTEFTGGGKRVGSKENEETERGIFGNVTEVVKFNYDDLKIAVYGDVANVTFHSDFHLKFGEDEAIVNDQITLLLVKTDAGWKCVHEHHSPLNKEEE